MTKYKINVDWSGLLMPTIVCIIAGILKIHSFWSVTLLIVGMVVFILESMTIEKHEKI